MLIKMAGKLRAEVRNAQVLELFGEFRQQKKGAGLIFGEQIRFAVATLSAAFNGRVDALLGKPRAMGLPVGMTLGRIARRYGFSVMT